MSKIRVYIVAIIVLLYVGSYLMLSRPAFAESRRFKMKGFYFFTPRNTQTWRTLNYSCVRFYCPLIVLDVWLGSGMSPASEPLEGLSR